MSVSISIQIELEFYITFQFFPIRANKILIVTWLHSLGAYGDMGLLFDLENLNLTVI